MTKTLYIHKKATDGEVFYVGIGREARAYETNRSKLWKRVSDKYGYVVEVLETNLYWEDACEKEIALIKFYGRIDLGTGTLVNHTDGGEGTQGVIRTPEQSPMWNKNHNQESIEKIRIGNLGKTLSQETKDKISASKKGCTVWNKGTKMTDEQTKAMSLRMKGKNLGNQVGKGRVHITNGIINNMIYLKDGIPEGFRRGRPTTKKQ